MNDNANRHLRSEKAPKLRRSTTRRKHGRHGDYNQSSSSSSSSASSSADGGGPSIVTMLFVAVALATIFNLNKSGGSDPATVHLKGHLIRGGGMSEEQYQRLQAQQQMNGGYHGNVPLMNGAPQQYMGVMGPNNNINNNNNAVQGFGYGTPQQLQQQQQPMQMQTWSTTQNQFQPMTTQQQQEQQPFVMQQMPMAVPQDSLNNQMGINDMIQNVENTEIASEVGVAMETDEMTAVGNVDAAPMVDGAATAVDPAAPAVQMEGGTNGEPVVPNAPPPPGEGGVVPNPILAGYKDNWDPVENGDQPVFWHIPKAGGSTVKDIMGTCHRFTMASEYGIVEGHENDPEIAVVRPGGVPVDQDPSPFVNVDPTTLPGIAHAKDLGLAESNLADCIVTPYIQESDTLFSPGSQGRLFTVFRHPVDRVISLFFYLQVADWEPTYNPDLAQMSIVEYAQSPLIENNWMVRQLTSSFEGDLTQEHLDVAMDIVRRKFMVGLLHEKERTMDRFEKFFGWKYRVNPENQEKCRDDLLTTGSNSNAANKKEKPKPGDEEWEAVAWQNQFDIQLYEFIEQLFEEQESFVSHVPDGFRMMDASCAKCVPPTFPKSIEEHMAALTSGETGAPPADLPPPPTGEAEASAAAASPPMGETVATAATIPAQPLPPAIPGEPVIMPDLPGYKSTTEPYALTDVPVFWHIPKAGGSTVKDIMGTCHRFTMASEYGIVEGHENDPEIAVVRPGGVPVDQDPSPFVNVDPTTIPGIAHAKELGLAESGLADCVVSPYIKESDELFSPGFQGRLFTVFRHPVDRAVSMFFYIQVADWEPTYNPDLAQMTIEEYAQSPLIENNWMVRQLTSAFEGDLNQGHLDVAKQIIQDKFMVGLLHEKERTMDRFEKFFRWKYRVNPENQEKCRENLLTSGSNSNAANKKEKPKPGDESWDLVAWQNQFDIALYEFIEELFEQQEQLVADIPDGFRMMDASCAKCVPPTFPDLSKVTA